MPAKTTAIRRLMADKPENELWMVILNEFTDAGLDALSVAEAARGQYDVRLVAEAVYAAWESWSSANSCGIFCEISNLRAC